MIMEYDAQTTFWYSHLHCLFVVCVLESKRAWKMTRRRTRTRRTRRRKSMKEKKKRKMLMIKRKKGQQVVLMKECAIWYVVVWSAKDGVAEVVCSYECL